MKELVEKSIYILREAKAQFQNPCICFSGGKDSTVLLYLARQAFFGRIPFEVVFVDTNWQFPETYDFIRFLQKAWNFKLVVARYPKILDPRKVGHEKCCYCMKTLALKSIIEKRKYDAVITSIRRDEHYIRNLERVFSPRDRNFRWQLLRPKKEDATGDSPFESLQPVELWNIYRGDFENVHHVRVHPLLHWTELDVWKYIQKESIPVNPLYFSRDGYRYRSIGCRLCTAPVRSNARTIDEIIAELETTRVAERAGRIQDKENLMRQLRAMGYF